MEGLLSTGPLRRLVFDQSSPVDSISESRGEAWVSHRRRRRRSSKTTLLLSNIGLEKHWLLCSLPTASHCSVALGHFCHYSWHGISQIQWLSRPGLAGDCLFSLAEWGIDRVTPLVTGPLRVKNNTRQNPPICNPLLYMAVTFNCNFLIQFQFQTSSYCLGLRAFQRFLGRDVLC